MKRPAPSSPLLDKPGVLLPKVSFWPSFFAYSALLFLSWFAAMGCFYTAFDIEVSPYPAVLWAAVCAVLCAAQFLMARGGGFIALPMALLWAFEIWLEFSSVLQGFLRTANVVIWAYRTKFALVIPLFHTDPDSPAGIYACTTLFATLLQFPFMWLMALLLIYFHSSLGAFFLSGAFVALPLIISYVPDGAPLGAMLVFWMFLLLAAPALGQRAKLLEYRRRYYVTGEAFIRPGALLLLPAMLLTLIGVHHFFPEETYKRPEALVALRQEVNAGVGADEKDEPEKVIKPAAPRQKADLNALANPHYTGRTVLQVRRSGPEETALPEGEPEYLKSFAGSVYTGDSWELFTDEEAIKAAYASADGFAQNQYGLVTAPLTDYAAPAYYLSVNRLSATADVYTPPYLRLLQGLSPSMEFVQDGFVCTASGLRGTGEYTFSAYRVNNPCLSYMDLLALTGEEIPSAAAVRDVSQADRWTGSDAGSTRAEEYSSFVYTHYTQLPDTVAEFLTAFRDEHGIQLADAQGLENAVAARLDYIEQVKAFLATECVYTLTPLVRPDEEDFALYFLGESREGFCVHFATAATLLFRSAGIPARYVQGYAAYLPENGIWTDIPDYCAHAWVEVYWGGVGWVPVEVTPAADIATPPVGLTSTAPSLTPAVSGSPDVSASPSPLPAQESLSPSPTASPSALPSLSPAASVGPTPDEGLQETDFRPPLYLLWLLIPFVLWGLLCLNRRLLLDRRERRFTQEDRNLAALALWKHMGRLKKLAAPYPIAADPPPEAEALALKARFSAHTLTAEELAVLRAHADEVTAGLKANARLFSRLRMKYILGLF